MLVDILAQPAVQLVKAPLPNVSRNLRVRRKCRSIELRRHDVAQGVALERAADQPAVPMHILHDAVPVVGRTQSEALRVAGVPGLGQIGNGKFAFQQVQFQPKADDDVQVIGDLVGLGANQRRFDAVDRGIELVDGDIGKLRRKDFLEARIIVLPESDAAANLVFPQPRLAFMDAGRCALVQRRALEGRVDAKLVQRVAGFM